MSALNYDVHVAKNKKKVAVIFEHRALRQGLFSCRRTLYYYVPVLATVRVCYIKRAGGEAGSLKTKIIMMA